MKTLILAAIRCSLMLLVPPVAYAISAQWDLDPISGAWNTPANWTPNDVPNGPSDIATFDLSHTTDVSISANTEVDSIIFTSAATNPYTVTASPGLTLTISGMGIVNNSGIAQRFVTAVDGSGNFGQIAFINSATAGTCSFTNNGSVANFVQGGKTAFFDTSTAGSGTFVNKGGTGDRTGGGITEFYDSSTAGNANFINRSGMGVNASGTIFHDTASAANGTFTNDGSDTAGVAGSPGLTVFFDTSTAANGTFINNGAAVNGAFGGATVFDDSSTAGNGIFINNGGSASGLPALGGGNTIFIKASNAANGTFINNAAPESGAEGGVTEFETAFSSNNASPSAGNGTFINNGASISGAVGGKTAFYERSTADAATLIANGGTNGGEGGAIFFKERSTGGTARVEVFGNGFLDISGHLGLLQGLTVGSVEGDGNIFLGAQTLTVGSNDLSTTFSGAIQDGGQNGGVGGSLTKKGSGTLILSGTNTYTGNTNVRGGALEVDGSITSNTAVNGGTLAGTGTINGNVTANGGTVRPGGLGVPGTLTVVNNYTQAQYAHLMIQIAGASAGQFSVLDVLGTANLNGGHLNPILLDGFVPTIGESFTFLNYGAVNGTLSIFNPNIDNLPEHWVIGYFPTFANLTVVAGNVHVPDQGSTFLLLALGLLGLVTFQRQLVRKPW